MKLGKLNILLAEDSPDDAVLFKLALRKAKIDHSLYVVEDGAEAIAYLRGEGQYADRDSYPFPTFCILDMKMPKAGGLEVLKWLRDHPDCSMVPVVVFTSSALPSDIKTAYQLAASAYFTKPPNLEGLTEMLVVIMKYWYLAHVPDPPSLGKCQ